MSTANAGRRRAEFAAMPSLRDSETPAHGRSDPRRYVPASLMLIDDHAILRDGLRKLLDCGRDFRVVADAGTLAEGIKLAKRLQPDAVIMDISFPEGGAIAAIGTLRRQCPGTSVIVLTVHNSEECLSAAMTAGAHGFVAKESVVEVLRNSIRAAFCAHQQTAHSLPFSGLLGALTVRHYRSPVPLTLRERQVLVGVAQGFTSREIAAMLGRSVKTVVKHRSNMMRKLSLHDASAVTRFAIATGLLSA